MVENQTYNEDLYELREREEVAKHPCSLTLTLFLFFSYCLIEQLFLVPPAQKLQRAIEKKDLKTMGTLIANGALNEMSERQKGKLLLKAYRGNKKEIAQLLLSKGIDANSICADTPPQTLLIHCLSTADLPEWVELLLSHGANPTLMTTGMHETALHIAINKNRRATKSLIEKAKDLDVQNRFGETPLHRAVFKERLDIVPILLARGAKTTIKDGKGLTPVDYLEEYSTGEEIKVLFEKTSPLLEKE